MSLINSTQISNPTSAVPENIKAKPQAGGFSAIMEKIFHSAGHVETLQKESAALHEKISSGAKFEFRDLLKCQIRAGEFNLRVELVSKLADSLISTTKRLQQSQ